jgi:hypothetical protein
MKERPPSLSAILSLRLQLLAHEMATSVLAPFMTSLLGRDHPTRPIQHTPSSREAHIKTALIFDNRRLLRTYLVLQTRYLEAATLLETFLRQTIAFPLGSESSGG